MSYDVVLMLMLLVVLNVVVASLDESVVQMLVGLELGRGRDDLVAQADVVLVAHVLLYGNGAHVGRRRRLHSVVHAVHVHVVHGVRRGVVHVRYLDLVGELGRLVGRVVEDEVVRADARARHGHARKDDAVGARVYVDVVVADDALGHHGGGLLLAVAREQPAVPEEKGEQRQQEKEAQHAANDAANQRTVVDLHIRVGGRHCRRCCCRHCVRCCSCAQKDA